MRRLERSHLMPAGHILDNTQSLKTPNRLRAWMQNFQFQAKKIDVFSRFGFPLVFFVFNVWYWSYYLTRSQKKWKSDQVKTNEVLLAEMRILLKKSFLLKRTTLQLLAKINCLTYISLWSSEDCICYFFIIKCTILPKNTNKWC